MPFDMNPYLDDILDNFEAGRCVILLGPNVPRDSQGRTLGEGLVEFAKDQVGFDLQPDMDGLFSFPSRRDQSRFPTILKRYLLEHCEPAKVHQQVAELPAPLMISLTPDHLLQQAFQAKGLSSEFGFYNKKRPGDLNAAPSKEAPLLYNLFGSIFEPDSLIATQDDLFTFLFAVLDRSNPLPAVVEQIVNQARLYLFVGFDFQQWYLKLLLRLLRLHEEPIALTTEPLNGFTGPMRFFYEQHFKMVFVPDQLEAFVGEVHQACAQRGLLRQKEADQPHRLFQSVREKVREDDLEEALDMLQLNLETQPQQAGTYNAVLQLAGRYHGITRSLYKGVIAQDQANVALAQIRDAILALTQEIEAAHHV